jgi:hypothetical protein
MASRHGGRHSAPQKWARGRARFRFGREGLVKAIVFWRVTTGCQHPHLTPAGSVLITDPQSEGLAHILEFVVQHQNSFVFPQNLGRQGLFQISTPTEGNTAAATLVNQAFDLPESALAEPVLA